MPGKYPTDPTAIAEIISLRTELKTTHAGLCKLLSIDGVTPEFLSRYINDNLDRQVPNFEGRLRDTIKSIRQRIAFGSEIFETSVTRRVRHALDLVRKTGDIALITSPAGNGKTSGINAYLHDNASAVSITLNATTRVANKIEGLVFRTIDHASWKCQSSRFDYLVDRFRDSSRLLLVDNAQRMDGSGRQWLFDFQDAAGCPIAMFGNPETLGSIRANDQQLSRIGMHCNYELMPAELPAAARRVTAQYSDPETADLIEDLCSFIAGHEGRLRAVRKGVILMQELRNASADLRNNPRKALRAAHARLVRDYELPND